MLACTKLIILVIYFKAISLAVIKCYKYQLVSGCSKQFKLRQGLIMNDIFVDINFLDVFRPKFQRPRFRCDMRAEEIQTFQAFKL